MDQAEGGLSRLSLAHRAVTETALSLQDDDMTGLLAFDVEPRWLLPPGHYPHPAQALESAWHLRAAGGTRLQPALAAAVEALAATPTEQRLLVLVTDGFVEGEDFGALQGRLAAANITVIALAVGEADTTVLQALAGQHDGKLLPVRELATLPRLMRQEVTRRRAAMVTEAGIPQLVQPLPWMSAAAWPSLQGYMITQARPEASVYLQSLQGDPLLAMQQTGSGRVLALPGGLGDWAKGWLQWPEFGRFLGGLVDWTDAHASASHLQLTLLDGSGELQALVDALGEDQDWSSAGNIRLKLRDPNGRLLDLTPEITAPGHYVARLPVQQNGPYRVTAWAGEQAVQQDILHTTGNEFLPPAAVTRNWANWLEQGLVQPWPESLKDAGATLPGTGPLQVILTLLAGVLYLGLLSVERGLLNIPALVGCARRTLERLFNVLRRHEAV
jgi:hypothetical protein